jgi:hypothetical protein
MQLDNVILLFNSETKMERMEEHGYFIVSLYLLT